MRKFLLCSICLLALSACNKEPTDMEAVPEDYDLSIAINELPVEPAESTKRDEKENSICSCNFPDELNEIERSFAAAVIAGDEIKVKELLAQGISPNLSVQTDCYPAICRAVYDSGMGYSNQKEREEVVSLLLEAGANANENCTGGKTPLMIASSMGRSLVTVKALLEAGADVNATDEEGRTALFKANNPEIVKALLAAGADINAVDWDGHNAFFDEYDKNGEVLKILLDVGIKVSQKDKDEALRKSCANASVSGVKVLLSYGANVNSKDSNGNTALMNAALAPLAHYMTENAETIIKMLVEAGADVNAVDNYGNTALIKVMTEWSDSDGVNEDKVELIDILVAAGANVNATNKEGKNALMSIYLEDYTDYNSIVKKLLSVGANINATDNKGRTVLMDFVSKVNEKNTDLLEKDNGDYPQQHPSVEKIKSFLNTLISVGVDINAKDNDGNTALKLAQKAGNTKTVELLKSYGAKE